MRRFRKVLLTATISVALLLPVAGVASADPGDPGGFSDPTIIAGPVVVRISAPGVVTITLGSASLSTTDPGDPGGFGP